MTLTGDAVSASALIGGRYRLGRLLGEGATKRVHHGIDEHLGRDVAIAIVKTEELDATALARVRREVRALVELSDDPSTVTVYDAVETPTAEYLVTEYLPGGDLQTWLDRHPGPCDPAVSIRVGVDVARSLERAHARDIVHRDVKPANVWLDAAGGARLGDFGLALATTADSARITGEGGLLGTVEYMAPETVVRGDVGPAADLYALGAMLYRMTTGRAPFTSENPAHVVHQHVSTTPTPPSHLAALPGALEALILALLEKQPMDRPISASEVRSTLEDMGDDPSSAAVAPAARFGRGLVGRDEELSRCRALMDTAATQASRVLVVEGEAGIGKTRLMQELGTYARGRGIRVVWSRGHEGPGVPPYWAWQQVIRECLSAPGPVLTEVLATLGPSLDLVTDAGAAPGAEHFRLANAVTSLLRATAADTPLLVILDDLQWADAESLQVLAFLATELGESRVLIAATYRDDEIGRSHPLAPSLATLARTPSAEMITLKALSREAAGILVEELCGGVPPDGLVDQVLSRGAGNPYFVAEMVRHATSDPQRWERVRSGSWSWSMATPRSVLDFVSRRVDSLSSACNEIVAVAAVVGTQFDAQVVRRVMGIDHSRLLDLLEEAKAAGVVVEVPEQADRYEFPRAIMRDALYDSVSPAGRIRLHGKIARAMEETYGANAATHLTELAHHFSEAAVGGDVDKALDYCRLAGHSALVQGDAHLGIEHFERALRVCELSRFDDTYRCDLLIELGEAWSTADDLSRARPILSEAIDLAQTLGLPRRAARATLAYCRLWPDLWRTDSHVATLLEQALASLPETDDPLRARLLARQAQERSRATVRPSETVQAASAVAMARRCGDRHALAHALLASLYSDWPDRPEHLSSVAQEIRLLAESVEDVDLCAHAAVLAGAAHAAQGDMAAAIRAHRRLRTCLHSSRRPSHRAALLMAEGSAAACAGDLDRALAYSATAGELARRQGMNALAGLQQFQWTAIAIERGRIVDVGDTVDRAVAASGNNLLWRTVSACARAAQDDPGPARKVLSELPENGNSPSALDHLFLESLLAELAALTGDTDAAAAMVEVLTPFRGDWITAGPVPVVRGPVARWLGILCATTGRFEEALGHFDEAAASEPVALVPAISATTKWWHGMALLAAGAEIEGSVALRQAERQMRQRDILPPPAPAFAVAGRST